MSCPLYFMQFIECSHVIMLCLGLIEMDSVTSELCYKKTTLHRNYREIFLQFLCEIPR